MRLRFIGSLGAFSIIVAAVSVACSSDDSSGGTGGDKPYEPAGNGVGMSEADACKAIVDAEDAKRAALACGPVTRPPCPTYLQKGNPACSEYDQGTVQACVTYIGQHTSCAALTKKTCVVKVIAGSAPNGCPSVNDAGPDAPEDTGSDAPEDTGNDAPEDTGSEAGTDAAADAPSDAAGD